MFSSSRVFQEEFIKMLATLRGKPLEDATGLDQYQALAGMMREYIHENWVRTNRQYRENGVKQVYYFSMEFLLGKLTDMYLHNLGVRDVCEQGLREMNTSIQAIEAEEPDAGLGNGGLGRLAACFLDSMASIGFPGHGCGIRYKFGHFNQRIIDGAQVEMPERWLGDKIAWEVRKPDKAVTVRFGGNVRLEEQDGRLVTLHENYDSVQAVPYDLPIVGHGTKTVNTLRLWNAEMMECDEDQALCDRKSYIKSLESRYAAEAISNMLYPDDTFEEGRLLRLRQEYFLVSAGLQSIFRSIKKAHPDVRQFASYVAIHINDTHPSLVIPELMRILMDEEGLGWDEAWSITIKTVSYTNHTVMPESMEVWPAETMRRLLPRIAMIIDEINERFCRKLWDRYPGDWDRIRAMAITADNQVKMVHLAVVGSHSVNGVSHLHTKILQKYTLKDFVDYSPYKFNNKTNGISHRRFLLKANPRLAGLISEAISPEWIHEPLKLRRLLNFVDDPAFQGELAAVKRANKEQLARLIKAQNGIDVDVDSIFDVQVKRIHAYKRQLLNVLQIIDLYHQLREDPGLDIHPRTFIFAGKAAPGYHYAKQLIRLINALAVKVNGDPSLKGRVKVVFLENYRVSLAETIIPAADVSQQITTASREASGTGNMKFMMNGALTLGTLDGANVEILEMVGPENMITFGLSASEVMARYHSGDFRTADELACSPRLQTLTIDLVNGFLPVPEGTFGDVYHSIARCNDPYFVLRDYASYADAQSRIDRLYRDPQRWLRLAAVNIAQSGIFSSDRTIREYAGHIWDVKPFEVV